MDYGVKFTKKFTQLAWSLLVPWFDITHKHTRTHARTHTHTQVQEPLDWHKQKDYLLNSHSNDLHYMI